MARKQHARRCLALRRQRPINNPAQDAPPAIGLPHASACDCAMRAPPFQQSRARYDAAGSAPREIQHNQIQGDIANHDPLRRQFSVRLGKNGAAVHFHPAAEAIHVEKCAASATAFGQPQARKPRAGIAFTLETSTTMNKHPVDTWFVTKALNETARLDELLSEDVKFSHRSMIFLSSESKLRDQT